MARTLPISFELLCAQFEQSCFPVWLTDPRLDVTWANTRAHMQFPAYCLADGLKLLLSSDLAQAAAAVQSGEPFTAQAPLLGRADAQLAFSPFVTPQNEQGAFVLYCPQQQSDQAQLHRSLDSMCNLAVSQSLRSSMSNAFSALAVCSARLRASGDDREISDQLQRINHSCYQVMRTAISLSDQIKLSAGVPPSLTTINFWDSCAELLDALQTLLGAAKKNFSYRLPQSDVCVHCDFERLSAALLGLVSNCYLYGGDTVNVTVTGLDGAGQVMLTIVDDGPGLPGEVLADPFTAFSTAEPLTRGDAGLGLGLHLVRELLGSMGGSVRLSSQPGGTVVALALPQSDEIAEPPTFGSSSYDYMHDRYSRLYVALCDVIPPPHVL